MLSTDKASGRAGAYTRAAPLLGLVPHSGTMPGLSAQAVAVLPLPTLVSVEGATYDLWAK